MQIHWRHPNELVESERERAEARIHELADGRSDLMDVWVDVEPSSAHHRNGDARVTIRGAVRRGSLVAQAADVRVDAALRKALDKFSHNVWNLRERRGDRRHRARALRDDVREAIGG